jgi:hypothetical protein
MYNFPVGCFYFVLRIFVIIYLIAAIHCSSANVGRINKRYYDAWEANHDGGNNNDEGESVQANSNHHKGSNKDDPCENKPLWFLKSQKKLGKLSPFYDCLN